MDTAAIDAAIAAEAHTWPELSPQTRDRLAVLLAVEPVTKAVAA